MIEASSIAAVVVLVSLVALRSDFARYSIATVGVFDRVDRRRRRQSSECVDCGETSPNGERVAFYRELVLCGVVVARVARGKNDYCAEHSSLEYREGIEISDEWTARIASAILSIYVELVELVDDDPSRSETSPFDDVVYTTSSAFDLLSVALLVIVSCLLMSCFGWMGNALGEA